MRVLLVSHGLPPDSVGGVEQHVDGLARALAALGHRVHVYTKTAGGGAPAGTRQRDAEDPARPYAVTRVAYRYEGLATLRDLYRVPLLDAAFREFLAEEEPFDVAHVHHLTGLSTGIVGLLRARGTPVVVTLHDYWTICPRGQMWHRDGSACETVAPERCAACLRPGFGGFVPEGPRGAEVLAELHAAALELLRAADLLVVPSARALPPFAALGVPAERVRVVENAVDTVRLAAVPPPDVLADRPLRLGYLGTLIPSKGLDVLVDAIARLPRGAARLDVFGNVVPYHGDSGFLTRVFARLTPADRVAYHGPYDGRALPAILGRLDVVVAPALWHEAFGLTVREALAAGRPIVVSRIGGLQDAVVDGVTGRSVPPGDVAALAAALEELCHDRPRTARFAEAARRVPVRGFEALATELAGVYRSLRTARHT